MGVKYLKDFDFPASGGFHSKAMPSRANASAKGVPARAKPNAPAHGAPRMESKPSVGKRQGYAEGGRVPGYDMDRLPAKKPPGRTMDLAPSKPERGEYQGYDRGGEVEPPKPSRREGLKPSKPIYQEPSVSRSYKKDDYKKMKPSYEIEVHGEPIKYLSLIHI